MKNKKVLIYYLLELVLTICLFSLILLFTLKLTVLNKNYFIKQLDKTNYYHELYTEIDNDFENYIRPSGFDISIKNNLFTEDDLKEIINKNVDNFYKGKKIEIDTSKIKEKLNSNIEEYYNKINITITDDDSINLFKEEFLKIYANRIIISDKINDLNKTFTKYNKLINILFISILSLFVILSIITRILFKKITLSIPIITSILLFIVSYIFIVSKINISSIKFWNTSVSNIIKNIFNDNIKYILYICIIGIILELLKLIIFIINRRRKKRV